VRQVPRGIPLQCRFRLRDGLYRLRVDRLPVQGQQNQVRGHEPEGTQANPQASRTPRVSQRDVMSATISRGWLAVDGASPQPGEVAALQGSALPVGISIEHERSVPDDRSETRLRGLVARIRLPTSIRSRSPVWRWATRVVGALVALAVAAFCPSEPTPHGASARSRIAREMMSGHPRVQLCF
jgi:hypothetical protein